MNKNENEEKKPIMPTLKAMKVGEKEEFPIERYDNVRITVSRLNLMMRQYGKHYSYMTQGGVMIVTRKA